MLERVARHRDDLRAAAAARDRRARLEPPRRLRGRVLPARAVGARARRPHRARERDVLDLRPQRARAGRSRRGGRSCGTASIEAAHRHGSLFSVASVHLFYGMTLLWRGDLAGGDRAAARRARRSSAPGASARPASATSTRTSCASRPSRRAIVAGARRILEPSARGPRARSDGDRYWLEAELHLLGAEGGWEDAAGRRRRRSDAVCGHVHEPVREPLALALRGGARPARPARRGARARRGGARERARSGARRARWATRCACSARSPAPTGSPTWRRPSPCSRARPRGWSRRRRWPRSAPRCAGSAGRPTRASRCAGRWSSRPRATRPGSPSTSAPSSTPPAHDRAPTRWPASPRSPPPSAASPTSPPRARPTATSPRPSSSPPRRSRSTSPTPTASSASAPAATSPERSALTP